MKKFLFVMLLSAVFFVSCGSEQGKAEDEEKNGRPIETITLENVYQGETKSFPENVSIRTTDARVHDGKVYIPGVLNKTETESLYICCVISPDNGELALWELPLYIQPTPEYEKAVFQDFALSRDRYAVAEYIAHVDMNTYKVTKGKHQLTVTDAEYNVLYTVDPQTLVQQRTDPYTGSDNSYSFYLNSLHFGANGTLYMVTEYSVVAVSPLGEKMYETGSGLYIEQAVCSADGRILVQYTDALDRNTYWAYMDDDAQGFSAPFSFEPSNLEDYSLLFGDGYAVYYQTRDGLYGAENALQEPVLLCSWNESGIDPATVQIILVVSENTFLCVLQRGIGAVPEYILLHRPSENESNTRKLVVLGDNTGKLDFSSYAAEFNRRSDSYYIEIRDYKQQTELGGNSLQEDILSGNAPDIVCTFAPKEVEKLEDKGAFADLIPYLESDMELKEDLFPCVTELFEKEEKLYFLVSAMKISAFVGKTEAVPQSEEWTLETFFALLDECQQNGNIAVTETTRKKMADMLIYRNLESFCDYERGICSFDSDIFLDVISYLKSLPEQGAALGESMDVREAYREGKLLLDSTHIGSFKQYLDLIAQFGDSELSFLGVPAPDGGKPVLYAYFPYYITADSSVADGAWEFIRYMISEEILSVEGEMNSYFPVTKSTFLQLAEEEKKWCHIYALDSKAHSILRWDGIHVPEFDETKQIAVWLRDENIRTLMSVFDERALYISEREELEEIISAIISEELEGFFADTATAKEAAVRIQSRTAILLSERVG